MSGDKRPAADITELLLAWSEGRDEARDELVTRVYEEMRRMAASQLRREPNGRALQPTELIHEAYLRLVDQKRIKWRNRAQFYGVASQVMRRILIDRARSAGAEKRGAGLERVPLEDDLPTAQWSTDVVALDEALRRLAAFDAQQSRIVELRYFGGLTIEEAAEALKISPATVVREWTIARAWLRAELTR